MKFLTKYFFLILLTFCACKPKASTESEDGSTKVEKHQFLPSDQLKNWICDQIKMERVCYPGEWDKIQQDRFLFFAYFDSTNDNSFFALAKHPVYVDLTIETYLKEAYRQLKSDTIDILREYSAKELVFKDNRAFYVEFMSEADAKVFITFCMYTIQNGYLFDFSLKVEDTRKAQFYQNFQDI